MAFAPVTVTGNLGTDGELKTVGDGVSVLELRIASNDRQKIDGQWEKTTQWVRATVWGRRGESLAQYMTKGTTVLVSGKPTFRAYESKKTGELMVGIDIRADHVELLGGRRQSDEGGAPSNAGSFDEDDLPF